MASTPILSIRDNSGVWTEIPVVRGPAGLPPKISIKSVQTLPYGSQSFFEVDPSSTSYDVKLNVGLSAGPAGSIDNMPIATSTALGGVKLGEGISSTLDGTISTSKILVGTCATAASTRAKVVAITDDTLLASGWTPKVGQMIAVKFTKTNSATSTSGTNVTLNVNSHGAHSISYDGAVTFSSNLWIAGTANRYTFYIWDGTNWVWVGQDHEVTLAHTHTEFDYLNQSVKTTASPTFQSLTVTSDINANKVYGAVYM